jgi:retron-type reverse transcriptase
MAGAFFGGWLKRFGGLWESIVSWENILEAARKAMKGKRGTDCVRRFEWSLMDVLYRLRSELADCSYRPGPYTTFSIHDKKSRMISAAPFRDRVVHHALCNVIMPIFEKTFVDTSFANRASKGTHRAVLLAQRHLRDHEWYLQMDIRKYFPSIDHAILKRVLASKIKCPRTRALIDLVIDGSNPQEPVDEYYPGDDLFSPFERRRGLPIGNLTSQYFANIYLSPLDHFVIERLRIHAYIRYVDDFVLFSDERNELSAALLAVKAFLAQYRLRIHDKRAQVRPVASGLTFLGYRVFPCRIRLRRDNPIAARRRIASKYEALRSGMIDTAAFRTSLMAWLGHAKLCNAKGLAAGVMGAACSKPTHHRGMTRGCAF